MAAKPVVDIIGGLRSKLPRKLTLANGDFIDKFQWLLAESVQAAITGEPVEMPFGRISRLPAPTRRFTNVHERVEESSPSVVHTGTFTTGTTAYQVTERDIVSITQVRATVGGTPNTIIPLAQVQRDKSDDYTTYDLVRFLGPTFPDNGGAFEVTHTHRKLTIVRASDYTHAFRLFIFVSDLAVGARASTTLTAGYDKTVLGEQLFQALLQELALLQGVSLSGGDDHLVLGETTAIGLIPTDRSESYLRVAVDVEVHQTQRIPVETVGVIGKVVPVADPSVT